MAIDVGTGKSLSVQGRWRTWACQDNQSIAACRVGWLRTCCLECENRVSPVPGCAIPPASPHAGPPLLGHWCSLPVPDSQAATVRSFPKKIVVLAVERILATDITQPIGDR